MENEMEMWMNCKEEEDLLFKTLHKDMYVLEWGSGQSTIAIAKRVRELVSIEHNLEYYNHVKKLLADNGITNVNLIYVPPNVPPVGDEDGDFLQFGSYIYAGYKQSRNELFDVIYVDGRARVPCCQMAFHMLKENGYIFVHDYRHPKPQYRRLEYEVIEQFLIHVDQAFAMGKFIYRQNLQA